VKIEKGLPLYQDPEVRLKRQEEQLHEASKLYEQHFMREMMKAMRQAIPESDLQPKGMGERIYSEQLDHQYVDQWSNRGGVGLADLIYTNIKEKFFAGGANRLTVPKGPLPLVPDGQSKGTMPAAWKGLPLKGDPASGNSSVIQFKGEPKMPTSSREVSAPWSGKVAQVFSTSEGINVLQIDHDNGLASRLTFFGTAHRMQEGSQVAEGQKLGVISEPWPELKWLVTSRALSTGPHNVVG
jgi:peptidoglycan hydrolase FlgJ